MEFNWKIDDFNSIFVHILFYLYKSPLGFDFDIRNEGRDRSINKNNLKRRAEELVDYFRNVSLHYQGSEIMYVFGDDF